MTIPDEVDIIVCGGGSAGCVVAGRLANLDHNLQVLLIEAGEDNLNNPWWADPKDGKKSAVSSANDLFVTGCIARGFILST